MDIRLKQLSYSSRKTLHKCARKYQLYRLNGTANEEDEEIARPQSVTFAFGHFVGDGVAHLLVNDDLDRAIWHCFLGWKPDLLDRHEKHNKNIWVGIAALQRFKHMLEHNFLEGWSLCYYQDRPAIELSFIINFPDGFVYRGFVDAVLQHTDGRIMVLECKTTKDKIVPAAKYKNSAQALGYSIVLDVLFPELSSYTVKYLVYKTLMSEYESPEFEKDYLARALWIREILLDIEILKMYEAAEIYPMNGESCFDFYRECDYFNLCTLSTARLTDPLTAEAIAAIEAANKTDFQINLSLKDLIDAQLKKEI